MKYLKKLRHIWDLRLVTNIAVNDRHFYEEVILQMGYCVYIRKRAYGGDGTRFPDLLAIRTPIFGGVNASDMVNTFCRLIPQLRTLAIEHQPDCGYMEGLS